MLGLAVKKGFRVSWFMADSARAIPNLGRLSGIL